MLLTFIPPEEFIDTVGKTTAGSIAYVQPMLAERLKVHFIFPLIILWQLNSSQSIIMWSPSGPGFLEPVKSASSIQGIDTAQRTQSWKVLC